MVRDPGPRFASDFAAATRDALAKMQAALEGWQQTTTPKGDKEREEFEDMVAAALRGLTNPAVLARSGLIERLHHTLAAAQAVASDSMSRDGFIAPLEQGQLLRRVLVAAIEKLRQNREATPGAPESPQYIALHHEYVLRWQVKAIATRFPYAERTVDHHRKDGIKGIAADLMAREEFLARQADGAPHTTSKA